MHTSGGTKEPEAKPIIKQDAVAEIIIATIEVQPQIIDLTEIEPAVIVKPKKKNNIKQTRGRMSLKDMDAGVDLIEVPEDEVLI